MESWGDRGCGGGVLEVVVSEEQFLMVAVAGGVGSGPGGSVRLRWWGEKASTLGLRR